MLKYSFSYILLLQAWWIFGQTDSVDWGPKKWSPSLLRTGVDVYRLVESAALANKRSFEGMLEVDFHKYFLVAEYGREIVKRDESFSYTSQGGFWRVGIDQNLIPYNQNGNVVTMGMRYAGTSFTDEMKFEENRNIGNRLHGVSNEALSARWIELCLGMRSVVWKNFTLGYQFRYKIFKTVFGEENGILQPFDVPGFGRHKKSSDQIKRGTVGFDYYIYWTFPLRDKYIPPKPRRF